MEDNDRLWFTEWLREFEPPDDAKRNEEVLAPFYAALKTRPPESLKCLIFFRKSKLDRLELSGSNTMANVSYSPVKMYDGFTSDECASIVNAVKRCPYLRSLHIQDFYGVSSTEIEELLRGQSSPLQELELYCVKMHTEAEVCMVAGSIRRIITLKTLIIIRTNKLDEILLLLFPSASKSDDSNILENLKISTQWLSNEYESVANMLRRDSKLMTLKLSRPKFGPGGWMVIFEALKVNSHLKKLDMSHSNFSDEDAQKVLGGIMDLLHVNFFLEEIDLSRTALERDGSYERVKTQLKKNASMHKDALTGLPMMKPKVARVFLCGFPFAGKTQLRKTMAAQSGYIMRAKQNLKALLPHSNLQRTTGIEVEVIDKTDVKISLWDLGGQDEYHAFHDLFIPNVNGYESACSFVILCSPVARDDANRIKEVKFKGKKAIESELDYWLRFISSNSTISEAFKPHVTLVFTHDDYVPKDCDIKDSLEDIVTTLNLKFQDSLQISLNHYFVNGTSKQSVKPLATFLEDNTREILKNIPKVFQVCEETQLTLARWNRDNPQKPLIKWEEFVNLCKPYVPSLGDEAGDRFQSTCQAIALALHDTGDVIYFEKLKYVVVNPNWFCHDIMGTILSLDEMCRTISRMKPVTDETGFLERKVLKSILEGSYVDGSILSKKTKKVEGVLAEDLIEIMVEMNLCFVDLRKDDKECEGGLFIPATLRNKSIHAPGANKKLLWQHHSDLALVYIGRRLECEDQDRTFLSQGFFPRLQVFFKKRFPSSGLCILEQNIISLRLDGKEVIVEHCRESQSTLSYDHMDGYIDILVKSSKSMAETFSFTKENVLNVIREVCYSPSFGCPGVKLVESILNPKCVEQLWGTQLRKDQAIRVETLIEDVKYISNSEYTANSVYLHEWPAPGGNDNAQDLLGVVVWQDLINQWYLELEECQVQFMDIVVAEPLDSPSEELTYFDASKNDMVPLDPQLAFVCANVCANVKGHMDKHHREVIQHFDNLSKKMEDIITLQKSLLPALSRNIDKVMDFSIHLQQRRVPRLMYLTSKDVSTCEWLITSLTPGVTSAQLHFMCEHRNGIHRVAGQEGYTLILAGEAALRARPYVIWGLRVVSILAKIGGLAVAGMGSLVGDLEKSIVKGFANAIPINPISSNFGEDCLPRKVVPQNLNTPIPADDEGCAAEQWMVDTLQGKDIATLFDLHRIRYTNGSNEVAWVCGKHKVEGYRGKTMEILPI